MYGRAKIKQVLPLAVYLTKGGACGDEGVKWLHSDIVAYLDEGTDFVYFPEKAYKPKDTSI